MAHARVDERRVVALNKAKPGIAGPVVYWMSRDQRAEDNWALLKAVQLADEYQTTVEVIFCLTPDFPGATMRAYDFMLKGLAEVEGDLAKKGYPYTVLVGDPVTTVTAHLQSKQIRAVVTDFSPLRIGREWRALVAREIPVSMYEVDAHNVVPAWVVSDKQEFAARTIRPKLQKLLKEFLVPFPSLPRQEGAVKPVTDWQSILKRLKCDAEVQPIDEIVPGSRAAKKQLQKFIDGGLGVYDEGRNDPNQDAQSGLSPYLHFGQLSAARAALEALDTPRSKNRDAFLEEIIVRRELADNFCLYNPHYDSVEGFPAWAKKTLREHAGDVREYLYTQEQFEKAETHDPLWNAAQREMARTGKMHGYMRMYWAKKILEWTATPEEAMRIAIYLNDRYGLDGRDPNGYVGIAWSIGGVHDRPWFNRPVYGSVRYMSASGAKTKFDVERYCKRFQ